LVHEFADLSPAGDPDYAPFVAAVALATRDAERRTVQRGIPVGWRNVVSQPQRTHFEVDGLDEPVVAEWSAGRDGFGDHDHLRVVSASPTRVVIEEHGVHRRVVDVNVDDTTGEVFLDGGLRQRLRRLPRFVDPADQVASGSLLAPMPGSVVRLHVESGATVTAGDPVLVLEAMKMQHTITAPHDGTVTDLPVAVGAQVAAGEVLAVVSTSSTSEDSSTSEGDG
jgi:propionyl-CoA carboxylase alpha chain